VSDQKQLRKSTLETLGLLVERYPGLRVGQIIAEAASAIGTFDTYYMTDVELARGLNQLFITYTQFEAAGIKP
jgi:hypothetical protein